MASPVETPNRSRCARWEGIRLPTSRRLAPTSMDGDDIVGSYGHPGSSAPAAGNLDAILIGGCVAPCLPADEPYVSPAIASRSAGSSSWMTSLRWAMPALALLILSRQLASAFVLFMRSPMNSDVPGLIA